MKKKRVLSRKHRALRNCGWIAVLLVLTSVLKLYSFLPVQAVRNMSDARDIENPKVVNTFYDGSLPITRFALWHLVQGDNAMMFCATGWHLLMGWYDRTWATVETWDGTGVYAGVYSHAQDEERVTYFYGRVDAESVESLTLDVDWAYWERDREHRGEVQYNLTPEDFFEKDGKQYFCAKLRAEEMWTWSADTTVTCVTGDGTVLETTEVDWRTWST